MLLTLMGLLNMTGGGTPPIPPTPDMGGGSGGGGAGWNTFRNIQELAIWQDAGKRREDDEFLLFYKIWLDVKD